jgi:hypothetical protein
MKVAVGGMGMAVDGMGVAEGGNQTVAEVGNQTVAQVGTGEEVVIVSVGVD